MIYAQVTANTITATQGRLPGAARRLDTQEWLSPSGGLVNGTQAEQEACGWFVVTDVARPPDTPTTTWDRTVELVATVATMVWTERAKTQAELDADTHAANTTSLEDKARASVASNITAIGQVPALVADMQTIIDGNANNIAQTNVALDSIATTVKRLLNDYEGTLRQLVAVERLMIAGDLLDTTDGT